MDEYENNQAVAVREARAERAWREQIPESQFDIRLWKRLECNRVPIYVRGDKPDWFVPNAAGDEILKRWAREGEIDGTLATVRFLERLPRSPVRRYPGRGKYLNTESLKELWFQLTSHCNQSCDRCRHQPPLDREMLLSAKHVLALAEQAVGLGCRVFVLTGGEPLTHPEFDAIAEGLMIHPDVHVAVLTNGTLLREHAKNMSRWPRERFHFQVDADGGEATFDQIRGAGAFRQLRENLAWLKAQKFHFSLSMCVDCENLDHMPDLVDLAAACEASHVHYMWYFAAGRGNVFDLAEPEPLFDRLMTAEEHARKRGVVIDNILALRRQVFSPAGTIYDGSSAGWESVTVGFDEKLYPSLSLCGVEDMATPLDHDLARAWLESPVLDRLRQATVAAFTSPMLLVLGGGDPDHSYHRSGEFVGFDPYWLLYENMALRLIAEKACEQPASGTPRLRLKMGDFIEHGEPRRTVMLKPTKNLFALATADGAGLVSDFYPHTAEEDVETTLNTVSLPEEWVGHIPAEYRVRSYGFGSPVCEADLESGQQVVEVGSDLGVECFIASRLVGAEGSVIGVEARQSMVQRAQIGIEKVAENLGYRNVEFRKGDPEELPVPDEFADVVISNCVINLSRDKRRSLAEIYRVLRQGGRLVVSDLVCEEEPVGQACHDNVVCSRCIASALTARDLFGLLEESGFVSPRVLKWLPYRSVGPYSFYRIVFQVRKLQVSGAINVMYRGPFASAVTHRGTVLVPGVIRRIAPDELADLQDDILVLDEHGAVLSGESTPGKLDG
jgi:MoaA/NifB/PqqE/SkfB family radical SAM enzyme/SAM-dependent methyltransferase